MTDRPILFSAPMVRALLDGRKTQTRRMLKPEPFIDAMGNFCAMDRKGKLWNYGQRVDGTPCLDHYTEKCVRFAKGDRLYVRETFSGPADQATMSPGEWSVGEPIWYWADGSPSEGDWTKPKPGIHMPRWASRLTLTVTDVRVQRVQECSEADCIAEGPPEVNNDPRTISGELQPMVVPEPEKPWRRMTPRAWYHELWDAINGAGAWDANPWIVAVTFTVDRRNIDTARAA